MKLFRSGTNRFLGWTTLSSVRSPKQTWFCDHTKNKPIDTIAIKNNKIELTIKDNQDPNSESSYNYCIQLTFKDIQQILATLTNVNSTEESNIIAENLKDSLADLVKLQYLIAGCHTLPKSMDSVQSDVQEEE